MLYPEDCYTVFSFYIKPRHRKFITVYNRAFYNNVINWKINFITSGFFLSPFITMWPFIKPDEIDVAEDEGWVVRRLVDRSRDHPAGQPRGGQPRSAKLILSQSITGWWFGMVWNHGIFDVSITVILGMSGEQLTFIFFKMVETTNQSQLILLKLLVREIYRYHRIRCRTRACVFSHMRSRTVKSSDLDLPKLFAGKLALVWEKWHLIKFKVQILEIVTLISGKHVELKECDYSHLIQHKNYYPLVI